MAAAAAVAAQVVVAVRGPYLLPLQNTMRQSPLLLLPVTVTVVVVLVGADSLGQAMALRVLLVMLIVLFLVLVLVRVLLLELLVMELPGRVLLVLRPQAVRQT